MDPDTMLRDFYDLQSDYALNEDDSAYADRKERERQDSFKAMEELPIWGLF
jgi:hypothetical protein